MESNWRTGVASFGLSIYAPFGINNVELCARLLTPIGPYTHTLKLRFINAYFLAYQDLPTSTYVVGGANFPSPLHPHFPYGVLVTPD